MRLALLLLGGCLSSVTPRPAQLAARGQVTADYAFPVYAHGSGTYADRSQNTGPAALSPFAAILQPSTVEVGARIGVGGGLELGPILGFTRIGGEARLQLLDERLGSTFSVAANGAGGIGTGLLRKTNPWMRGGFDASIRGGDATFILSPAITWGDEAHVVSDPDLSPALQRRELRAHLGVGIVLHNWRRGLLISGVPYATLHHLDPRCDECDQRTTFDEDWGFVVAIGGVLGPPTRKP